MDTHTFTKWQTHRSAPAPWDLSPKSMNHVIDTTEANANMVRDVDMSIDAHIVISLDMQ